MKEVRDISLMTGDPPIRTLATVALCESSASITFEQETIHIPWSEIAAWIAWLAEESENRSE